MRALPTCSRLLLPLLAALLCSACDGAASDTPAGEPPFPYQEAGIAERQARMTAGELDSVTLTDAPASVQPAGVDADLLVVHQQDIQAVANALWRGGAEAMTIQGQRVSSRTGIKCVGNTVVLHGVPYAPPYVITAIGDQARLEKALADSPYMNIYREYVDAYRLGYAVQRAADVTMPAYDGPSAFERARIVR